MLPASSQTQAEQHLPRPLQNLASRPPGQQAAQVVELSVAQQA